MSELYHVSSSPHVRAKDTTSRIMLYVIIALLPTSIFGIVNFGDDMTVYIDFGICCKLYCIRVDFQSDCT